MSGNIILKALPLIVAAGVGFFAYTSCDQLPDEKTGDAGADQSGSDSVVTVAKGVVCDELVIMESYPVQYNQKCRIEETCTENVVIPVAEDGDTATLTVFKKETKESLTFSYDEEKKSIRISTDNCPVAGTAFTVAYTGQTNEQLNNSTINNANFTCTSTISETDPAKITTLCKVKETCVEASVYRIPLHTSFDPVDGVVEYTLSNSKQPAQALAYDATKHVVTLPANMCSEKGVEFTINYAGKQKVIDCDDGGCLDAPDNEGVQTLSVHPCGNFDPVTQSCDGAGGYVDLVEADYQTCQELGLKAGDVCTPGLVKCVMTPPKACGNAPTEKAVSAYFLHCNEGPIENAECPVSERKHKKSIAYVSQTDLQHLKDQIDHLKLARYEYKDQAVSAGPQLGFIIEDQPDAEFISADGKRVNIYAFASSLAAALQVQSKEIDQLRAEINLLKAK